MIATKIVDINHRSQQQQQQQQHRQHPDSKNSRKNDQIPFNHGHHHHRRQTIINHCNPPPSSTTSLYHCRRLIVVLFHVTLLFINQCYSWSLGNLLMTSSQATLANFETVWAGAQKGLDECARQFQYERWPCPDSILSNAYQNNLPINREIAFVQAIISAGIVHTVTRNCSSGSIDNCKCSKSHPTNIINNSNHNGDDKQQSVSDFRWGGCSDNVELGYKIAMAYLDDRETGKDFRARIRLHNHQVGRLAVKSTMIRKCKCHGVSGSCSMQTCWMKANEFREVGNYLKKAYNKAVQIESNRPGEQSTITDVPNWKLVYLQDSPDYCRPSNSTMFGVTTGTLGRKCSMRKGDDVPVDERKSCRRLCKQCGYRVKRDKHQVTTSCNCKFEFCCEVHCQTCTKEEFSYVCDKIQ